MYVNASIYISGDNLGVKNITVLSSLEPLHCHSKGDKITERRSKVESERKTGLWCISTEDIIDSDNPDVHINFLMSALKAPVDVARKAGEIDAITIAVTVGLEEKDDSSFQCDLSPQMMRKLADEEIKLVLLVLCPTKGEEGERE